MSPRDIGMPAHIEFGRFGRDLPRIGVGPLLLNSPNYLDAIEGICSRLSDAQSLSKSSWDC
ncbi:uncharacterized protein CLUP02_01852 [Colletotrichum lupini]|uniref:Uncharacterized protein n=1 Tax=Colletotrichum lupini TaxID=145971 RepID=A0A9Q8SD62_9PEZI|nr:uncharacterized protein CLUP02_01852 [Colletotrichum lupini]UQC75199.1 hypothetical protein CLUP02_01852 [Colletotrichum lupini]